MRTVSGTRTRLLATVLTVAAVALVISGCASSPHDVTVVAGGISPIVGQSYPGVTVVKNQAYGSDPEQTVDVCLPKADPKYPVRAALLAIHGGSWARGDKADVGFYDVCRWLASKGFVTASVDYRLAPAHPFPAGLDDVHSALNWLRAPEQVERFGIDPERIGAFGGSAGGNLAAMLGTTGTGSLTTGDRIKAVVELSGPADLTESARKRHSIRSIFVKPELSYLGCAHLATCANARLASPRYQVSPDDPPFFIGHSTREFIPLAQSKSFAAALNKVGVTAELAVAPGDRHSIGMLDTDMRAKIIAFLAFQLDQPAPSTK